MTRLLVADLLPNTNYAIRVRAVGPTGISEWSNRRVFLTISDVVLPSIPLNVVWDDNGSTFQGSWDAVTENEQGEVIPITRYEVELVANAVTKYISVGPITGADGRVHYELTLASNRTLFGAAQPSVAMRVRAVDNKELKSGWSPVITATNAAPGPPTGVTATAAPDAIQLKWVAPTGVDNQDIVAYNIYTSADVKVGSVSGQATSFTYVTATYTSQSLKVAAVDEYGQISTKVSSNAVTPTSPFVIDDTPPNAPTGLGVTFVDVQTLPITRKATVSWTAPTGTIELGGYHVRWKRSADAAWQMMDVAPDNTSVEIGNLAPDTAYDFSVRAYGLFANFSAWVDWTGNTGTATITATLFDALKISAGGFIESTSFGAGVGYRIDDTSITIHDGSINGAVITTGVIRSMDPAIDIDGLVIPGEYAWQIDLQGDAVLGNAKVRGNLVVGSPTETQVSVMQSANFVAGVEGWQLRSDGTGTLIGLGANTIHGNSIITSTLTAAAIGESTSDADALNAVIRLHGMIEAKGIMGESVQFGGAGFKVIGAHESNITFKNKVGSTVTLTTAENHGYAGGSRVVISGVGSPFPSVATPYTIDPTPTATTFSITDATFATFADVSEAVIGGLAQGEDVTGSRDRPVYVDFPTDGAKPNIISGVLSATSLVVSENATFRALAAIETGAKLTIASAILPPVSAPAVSSTYNAVSLTGIPGTGLNGVVKGHNGNKFVLSFTFLPSPNVEWYVSEHDANTGALIAIRFTKTVPHSLIEYSEGFVYYNNKYYVLMDKIGGVPTPEATIYTIDSATWTVVGTTVLSHRDDYMTIGWNFNANQLVFATQEFGQDMLVRQYALDANGIPLGTEVSGSLKLLSSTEGPNNIKFIAIGNFDLGAERIVMKTYVTNSNTLTANFWTATPLGAVDSVNRWPAAYNNIVTGGYWDTVEGKFYSMDTEGILYEYAGGDSVWSGSAAAQRWISYSWYDSNTQGTIVPATGVATHETTLGKVVSLQLTKRAIANVTITAIPAGPGLDTPNAARIYMATTAAQPALTSTDWKLRTTINYPSTSGRLQAVSSTVGLATPKTSNEFTSAASTPGEIRSTSGKSYWKGDDTAQFYQLILTSDTEAQTTTNNKPALRIGTVDPVTGRPMGQHLRIDSNEIIAMESDTSRTGGELELSADTIRMNLVGGGLIMEGGTAYSAKIRTQNSTHTALTFDFTRLVASTTGWVGEATGPGNTVGFVAKNITAHDDIKTDTGFFDLHYIGGGVTGATINDGGRIIRTGSSRRYKNTIQPMSLDEAERVLRLEPVTFLWNEDLEMGSDRHPGFIAEQAHDADATLWVTYDIDRRPDGIRYPELTAAHNILIKELYKKNQELEDRIAFLED